MVRQQHSKRRWHRIRYAAIAAAGTLLLSVSTPNVLGANPGTIDAVGHDYDVDRLHSLRSSGDNGRHRLSIHRHGKRLSLAVEDSHRHTVERQLDKKKHGKDDEKRKRKKKNDDKKLSKEERKKAESIARLFEESTSKKEKKEVLRHINRGDKKDKLDKKGQKEFLKKKGGKKKKNKSSKSSKSPKSSKHGKSGTSWDGDNWFKPGCTCVKWEKSSESTSSSSSDFPMKPRNGVIPGGSAASSFVSSFANSVEGDVEDGGRRLGSKSSKGKRKGSKGNKKGGKGGKGKSEKKMCLKWKCDPTMSPTLSP